MFSDLEGRTALVTGASAGIGRAIATMLADNGVTVVGLDLTDEPNDDGPTFAERVESGELVMGDVSEPEAVDRALETAREYGPVTIAINNAGIKSTGPLTEISPEEWRQQLAVHVDGTYNVCRRVIPEMKAEGGGSIVNLSSVAAIRGYTGKADYGAAKGAVKSLVRHISADYSPSGVRANAIAPGFIKTGRSAHLWDESRQAEDDYDMAYVRERTMLPYLGEPEDVAAIATFLASEASRFITGETIVIDGGWSAW